MPCSRNWNACKPANAFQIAAPDNLSATPQMIVLSRLINLIGKENSQAIALFVYTKFKFITLFLWWPVLAPGRFGGLEQYTPILGLD